MEKTTFESLTQSQRILANTLTFLQVGIFAGKDADALAEAQKFIAQLHNQTTTQVKEAFNEKFKEDKPDTASAA